VTIEKVESSGGRFEITVDGALVYSKASTGRFPAYQEIPKLVVEALS
jgi:selT/selW/selH-like putative selenoprotein